MFSSNIASKYGMKRSIHPCWAQWVYTVLYSELYGLPFVPWVSSSGQQKHIMECFCQAASCRTNFAANMDSGKVPLLFYILHLFFKCFVALQLRSFSLLRLQIKIVTFFKFSFNTLQKLVFLARYKILRKSGCAVESGVMTIKDRTSTRLRSGSKLLMLLHTVQ